MKKTGLADKVVLITGGAAGIGRATALRFAEEGAKVVAWDLRPEAAELLAELAAAGAPDAVYAQVDVQNEAAVAAAVAAAVERCGRIDVLVNNAGITRDSQLIKWKDGEVVARMGSSIPYYFRKPEKELTIGTPVKNSIVIGGASDEGAIFHCIDVLQAFVELRKGGETGVKSVQSVRGPEAWEWVEKNQWAGRLLDSVAGKFELKPGTFQEAKQASICIIEYRDKTKAAVISGRGVGWTWAGEIDSPKEAEIISMLGWPGPYSQYHASNAQPHWITEMMVTGKEPYNAERLLLSTGITNQYMESNWENGQYSAVGRRIETPFLNIGYNPSRGPMFEKGERPPNIPYIRGFES